MPNRRISFLACLVALVGCADPGLQLTDPIEVTSPRSGRLAFSRGTDWSEDDEQARIAREDVRGYAGMYLSGPDEVTVLLAKGDDREVRRGIEGLFHTWGRRWRVRRVVGTRTVQYDFNELQTVRRALYPLLEDISIRTLDIDEVRNRVVVGLGDLKDEQRLRSRVGAAGLDQRILVIERQAPDSSATTLVEPQPYASAGLGIFVYPAGGGSARQCSIGAVGTLGGTVGAITASHCTPSPTGQGRVDGDVVYQGGNINSAFVAVEAYDPPYRTGGDCAAGYRCRFSDALWASASTIATPYVSHGCIANTTAFGVPYEITLGIVCAWTIDFHEMEPSLDPPVAGQELVKIGSSTGWTSGTLTHTCQDSFEGLIQLKCQERMTMNVSPGVDAGDSGGPVFQELTGSSAIFEGITARKSNNTLVFSRYGHIRTELELAAFPRQLIVRRDYGL